MAELICVNDLWDVWENICEDAPLSMDMSYVSTYLEENHRVSLVEIGLVWYFMFPDDVSRPPSLLKYG